VGQEPKRCVHMCMHCVCVFAHVCISLCAYMYAYMRVAQSSAYVCTCGTGSCVVHEWCVGVDGEVQAHMCAANPLCACPVLRLRRLVPACMHRSMWVVRAMEMSIRGVCILVPSSTWVHA